MFMKIEAVMLCYVMVNASGHVMLCYAVRERWGGGHGAQRAMGWVWA